MSGDKERGQTGAAEPLVLLQGKVGHELLTGARSNKVKLRLSALLSSEETTALVWTTLLRPHSRLHCQQETCHLYRCYKEHSRYRGKTHSAGAVSWVPAWKLCPAMFNDNINPDQVKKKRQLGKFPIDRSLIISGAAADSMQVYCIELEREKLIFSVFLSDVSIAPKKET